MKAAKTADLRGVSFSAAAIRLCAPGELEQYTPIERDLRRANRINDTLYRVSGATKVVTARAPYEGKMRA